MVVPYVLLSRRRAVRDGSLCTSGCYGGLVRFEKCSSFRGCLYQVWFRLRFRANRPFAPPHENVRDFRMKSSVKRRSFLLC